MIIKASRRSGATQLGLHLLKPENEHVELHEVRGFMADDVLGAFKEAQAMASVTKCEKFLFSVSLNPPETASVRPETFEQAADAIEQKLGLEGQPRVILFHEKEGRRHAHVVWSRIDAETLTAKRVDFFKTKLREISKQLYLENGWQMPRGLMDSQARDPRNFTLADWQQAQRSGLNAKDLRGMVQECWAVSDNCAAFAKALEERGLYLAKGDRRAHVAVSYEGEVFSLARLIDKRTKEVTAKLGKADDLPSVTDTKARIAEEISPRLSKVIQEAKRLAHASMQPLLDAKQTMQAKHAQERDKLDAGQKQRWEAETAQRASRLRGGVRGLWDRVTGRHQTAQKQNEAEAFFALQRDKEQRHAVITAQLRERQELQARIQTARTRHAQQILALHHQAANFRLMADRQEARGQDRARDRDSERYGSDRRREFNRNAEGRDLPARDKGKDQGTGQGNSTPPRNGGGRGPELGR
jgi:predicted mannosyl-3-phosphoglycerate phosphatase (HAD superfamily)